MDRLNRLVATAIALLIAASAVVTLLVVTEAIAPDFLPGGSVQPPEDSWFEPQLRSLANYSGSGVVITVLLSIVAGLLGLALFVTEFLSFRQLAPLLVSNTAEGALTVEGDSIRVLAERTGSVNRQVLALRCRIRPRGRRTIPPMTIIVYCYPRLLLGSNLQEVRDDLQTRIKSTIENLAGLRVLRVHVARVRYDRGEEPRHRLLGA